MTEQTTVTLYSGSSYAERPRTFTWQGQQFDVDAVIHQWRFPSGPGWRVRTTGGAQFELLYREADDHWEARPLSDN